MIKPIMRICNFNSDITKAIDRRRINFVKEHN